MIWDINTLNRVRRLRCRLDIDKTLPFKSDLISVIANARRKLSKELIAAAEPYGAILHPEDTQFWELKSPEDKFIITIGCQWWPKSRTVRIIGGPLDGQELDLPNRFEQFYYQLPTTELAYAVANGGDRLTKVDYKIKTMAVCGWSEESRLLLYKEKE